MLILWKQDQTKYQYRETCLEIHTLYIYTNSILLYCSAAHSKCPVTICIELTRLFCTSQFRSIEKSFYKENKCCAENGSGSGNISQLGLANQHTFICSREKKKSMTDLNCVPIPIMFCRLESHGAWLGRSQHHMQQDEPPAHSISHMHGSSLQENDTDGEQVQWLQAPDVSLRVCDEILLTWTGLEREIGAVLQWIWYYLYKLSTASVLVVM